MRYSFIGKNIDITDNFQDKLTKKLGRIEKLFPENAEATVSLSDIKLDKKAEVTVTLPNKRVLKAEVIKDDVMAAMDEVVDILEDRWLDIRTDLMTRLREVQALLMNFMLLHLLMIIMMMKKLNLQSFVLSTFQ